MAFPTLFEIALASVHQQAIKDAEVLPVDHICGFPVYIPTLADQLHLLTKTLSKAGLDPAVYMPTKKIPFVTVGNKIVCEVCKSTISQFQAIEVTAEKTSGFSVSKVLKNPIYGLVWRCRAFTEPRDMMVGAFRVSVWACELCVTKSRTVVLDMSTEKCIDLMLKCLPDEDDEDEEYNRDSLDNWFESRSVAKGTRIIFEILFMLYRIHPIALPFSYAHEINLLFRLYALQTDDLFKEAGLPPPAKARKIR